MNYCFICLLFQFLICPSSWWDLPGSRSLMFFIIFQSLNVNFLFHNPRPELGLFDRLRGHEDVVAVVVVVVVAVVVVEPPPAGLVVRFVSVPVVRLVNAALLVSLRD